MRQAATAVGLALDGGEPLVEALQQPAGIDAPRCHRLELQQTFAGCAGAQRRIPLRAACVVQDAKRKVAGSGAGHRAGQASERVGAEPFGRICRMSATGIVARGDDAQGVGLAVQHEQDPMRLDQARAVDRFDIACGERGLSQ